MSRAKTNSMVLDKASTRLQGMRAINATLDLGSGLSVTAFEAAINDARIKQDAFNQQASILQEKQIAFENAEKIISEISTRVLSIIAGKFGKDSIEYAQIGGTRSSERKHGVRKPKSKPES